MFSKIKNYFKRPAYNAEYSYLADSCDLVDLERRQRQVDRGQAPFQQFHQIHRNGY